MVDSPGLRLISPIATPEEAPDLVAAGADELYCGLRGTGRPVNRREMAEANLSSLPELDAVIQAGVPVSLVLNAPFYSNAALDEAMATAEQAARLGVAAIIAADPGLMFVLSQELPLVPVYASAVAGALNPLAVEALVDLGAQRVILPRHLSIDEISHLTSRSTVPLEVFALDWKCPNVDAFCCFAHEAWAGVLNNGCCQPFEVTGPNGQQTPKCAAVAATYRQRRDQAAGGCAACLLPALTRAGVTHFKLVGRRLTREKRLRNLQFMSTLRASQDHPEYERFARQLREAQLESSCVQGQCYYRP